MTSDRPVSDEGFDWDVYNAVMGKQYPFFRHDPEKQSIYDAGFHEAARLAARIQSAAPVPPVVVPDWLSTTNQQLVDAIAAEVDPTYREEGGRLARLRAHNIIVAIRETLEVSND